MQLPLKQHLHLTVTGINGTQIVFTIRLWARSFWGDGWRGRNHFNSLTKQSETFNLTFSSLLSNCSCNFSTNFGQCVPTTATTCNCFSVDNKFLLRLKLCFKERIQINTSKHWFLFFYIWYAVPCVMAISIRVTVYFIIFSLIYKHNVNRKLNKIKRWK